VVLAACGDTSEKNDYVGQVNDIQEELVNEITAATQKATLTSQKDAADYAATIAGIFSDAADRFETIDPPADVADLHTQLVDQVRSIGTDTAQAEKTLRNGSAQEAQRALKELQNGANAAQAKLTSLINQINSALQE
jgi:Skp family chaperone for outer membrane proteins